MKKNYDFLGCSLRSEVGNVKNLAPSNLFKRQLSNVFLNAVKLVQLSFLVLLLGLGAVKVTAQCTCPGNLIANPSFETQDFSGWTLDTNDPGQTSFAGDATYAVCGTYYAYFNPTAGNSTDYVAYYQNITAAAGNAVSLTVYAGVHDPTKNHELRLQFFNASNTLLSGGQIVQVDNDVDVAPMALQQYSLSGTAPAGTSYARVTAYCEGAWSGVSTALKVDGFCMTISAGCTQPSAPTFTQVAPGCSGATPLNNGTITLTAVTNGTHFGVSTLNAGSYDGPTTIATATAISLPQLIKNNIPNTGGNYIVRIFNGADGCFIDQTVMVAAVTCTSCSNNLDAALNGQTLSVCDCNLYDSGGPSGNYSPSQNYTVTYQAPVGQHVKFVLNSLATEPGFDNLKVFDSPTVVGDEIAYFTSPFTGPATVISSGQSLTLQWFSDGSVVGAGFDSHISCVNAGSIGDYIWRDVNSDGIQNDGNNGLNSLRVFLYKETSPGVYSAVDSAWTHFNANTSVNGYYIFNVENSGTYKVKFPIVGSEVGGALTLTDTGMDDAVDSDVDPGTGFSPPIVIDVNGTGIAKDNLTIDAGYKSSCSIPVAGGTVAISSATNGTTVTNLEGGILVGSTNNSTGIYGNNENYTLTIQSPMATGRVNFHAKSLSIAAGDMLEFFDGPTTASPLLATVTGTTTPTPNIVSTGRTITLRFTSNASGTGNYTFEFSTGDLLISGCWGWSTLLRSDLIVPNTGYTISDPNIGSANAPVCMAYFDANGNLEKVESGFCINLHLAVANPRAGRQYGQVSFDRSANLPSDISPINAARFAWILANAPAQGFDYHTSASAATVVMTAFRILMGQQTGGNPLVTAAIAAVPTVPPTPVLTVTDNSPQPVGSAITYTITTNSNTLNLSVSDGGALPVLCGSNPPGTSLTGNVLTVGGSGTRTVTVCLTRNVATTLALDVSDPTVLNNRTVDVYYPCEPSIQRFVAGTSDVFYTEISEGLWQGICVQPSAPTFTQVAPTCVGATPQNNGAITLTAVTNGTHFGVSTLNAGSYDGPTTIATATAISLPQLIKNNIPNTGGTYIVRIFNGADDCFLDQTVMVAPVTCNPPTSSCNCTDYMYLNDVSNYDGVNGFVHKFRINPDGTVTEMPNGTTGVTPWFPVGGGLPSPHGLGQDLNGNLYIGEGVGGDIRKLTCDGTILPETGATGYLVDNGAGFNIGSTKEGVLYTNPFGDHIAAYDICTGTSLGYVKLSPYVANTRDWGMFVAPDGTIYSTATDFVGGGPNTEPKYIWKYKPTAADLSAHTTYTPFIDVDAAVASIGVTNADLQLVGITVDNSGNIYTVAWDNTPSPDRTYIFKFNSAGALIDNAFEANDANTIGYEGSFGIVYDATLDRLYLAGNDDCVAIVSTGLDYLGTGVAHVSGATPKGVALARECCPASSPLTVDTTLCNLANNQKFFLQNLIGGDCDGPICGGVWTPGSGNTGMTFSPCDNSVTITDAATACGSFSLVSAGGSNTECGAFSFTVNVDGATITGPTISADQTICSGAVPTALTSSGGSGSSTPQYQWQSSTTSCTAGFANIAGANASGYAPGALSATTYYRLITSVEGNCNGGSFCQDTSNCVTITVNTCSCTQPSAPTFTQVAPGCTGATALNNGTITLTAVTNGTHFGVSTINAGSYNGPTTIAMATAITLPQLIKSSIPNTGGTYIVRIFNGADSCFVDQTVTVAPVTCNCPTLPCGSTTVIKN